MIATFRIEAGGDDYCQARIVDGIVDASAGQIGTSQTLRERADKDVLTGLLIRRAFVEVLHGIQDEAQRHGFPYCIALIDVDHFKQVNDTYGHIAGDRVLAHLGQLSDNGFAPKMPAAGGVAKSLFWRFVMNRRWRSKARVERVLAELRGHEFAGDHGEHFNVTFSCGMAGYPEDGPNSTTCFWWLIAALLAKESGRNRVVSADPVETGCA